MYGRIDLRKLFFARLRNLVQLSLLQKENRQLEFAVFKCGEKGRKNILSALQERM